MFGNEGEPALVFESEKVCSLNLCMLENEGKPNLVLLSLARRKFSPNVQSHVHSLGFQVSLLSEIKQNIRRLQF